MNLSTPGPCWITMTAGKARPMLGMARYSRIGDPSTSIRSHWGTARLLSRNVREKSGPEAEPVYRLPGLGFSRAGASACGMSRLKPGPRRALASFARHQAGTTPDDAPALPGGVFSILISFRPDDGRRRLTVRRPKETAVRARCQAATRHEVAARPGREYTAPMRIVVAVALVGLASLAPVSASADEIRGDGMSPSPAGSTSRPSRPPFHRPPIFPCCVGFAYTMPPEPPA